MKHAALALCLVACAGDPPDFISLDEGFTEAQRETVLSAIDARCEKVGWCPTVAAWTERGRIIIVEDLDERGMADCPEGKKCAVAGRNDGDNIRVVRAYLDSPADLWYIIAHESGHYCSEHTKTGIMSAYHAYREPESEVFEIDDVSARAWREGCP